MSIENENTGNTDFELENSESKKIRLVIIGDSKGKEEGLNRKVFEKLLRRIKNLSVQPDYCVMLGDAVSGGDEKKLKKQLLGFKTIFSKYFPLEKLIPVIGNHEVGNNPEDGKLEKIFSEIYPEIKPKEVLEGYNKSVYYLDILNTRLIVLNTCHYGENKKIEGKQLEWLKKAVEEEKEHKLLFMHFPLYPTGAHYGKCLDSYPACRDELWKVIDYGRVDIVFTGHEHNYSRRIVNKYYNAKGTNYKREVYQIISGGGGEKLKDSYDDKMGVITPPRAVHHFVIVDIKRRNKHIMAVDIEGKTIDDFDMIREL